MSTRLTVKHTTLYRYRQPVRFGEHRLMFRPRDSHDMRLVSTVLEISPPATVRWLHDVFGNSIAIATFAEAAAELSLESDIVVDLFAGEEAEFAIEPYARNMPFAYASEESRIWAGPSSAIIRTRTTAPTTGRAASWPRPARARRARCSST